MPRAKKDDRHPDVTLTEWWDVERAKQLILLTSTPLEVVQMLQGAVKAAHGGQVRVPYRHAAGTPGEGRLYASGPALQRLPAGYRRLVIADAGSHFGVDVTNEAPTGRLAMAEELNVDAPGVERYVRHRDTVIAELQAELGVDRATAKDLVLVTLNFGSGPARLMDLALLSAYSQAEQDAEAEAVRIYREEQRAARGYLAQLRAETERLFQAARDAHPERYEMVRAAAKPGKSDPRATFMVQLDHARERKAMRALQWALKTRGYDTIAYIHDELVVRPAPTPRGAKRAKVDHRALLQQAVTAALPRVRDAAQIAELTFTVESLAPTAADLELLDGEAEIDDKKPFAGLIAKVVTNAKLTALVRMAGHVMEPHPTVPGVYVQGPEAAEYINSVLLNEPAFHEGFWMKKLTDWFGSQDHPQFPLIHAASFDRTTIAFRDGQLDKVSCQFYEPGDPGHNPDLRTLHYLDCNMAELTEHTTTPLWDKLLCTQLYNSKDPADWGEKNDRDEITSTDRLDAFNALVGRLFLPTKAADNWQSVLFLYGNGDTGKSTLLNIIAKTFPAGTIDNYSANRQDTFGLEGAEDAWLVMFPDCPADLRKALDETVFNSMVSGEGLTMVGKNQKNAKIAAWTTPLLMAANKLPGYNDRGGRFLRRLLLISFKTYVTERDTTLEARIVADELPALVVKCLIAYRNLRDRVGSDELRPHLPDGFLAAEDEVTAEASPLYNFIRNGDDHHKITYQEGAVTTQAQLKDAFHKHVKFTLQQPGIRWPDDDSHIKKAGFLVKKVQMCKICGKPATKRVCDAIVGSSAEGGEPHRPHWAGGKNRSVKVSYLNMSLVSKRRF